MCMSVSISSFAVNTICCTLIGRFDCCLLFDWLTEYPIVTFLFIHAIIWRGFVYLVPEDGN
ncbi:hypothetical protein DPMN_071581 [Dreissena polymorpha]|uniref:Uncharacterized protein n=1 Tax=Dreissena polymorpha TaxID=45954 RepID=A0A9D4BVW3_DREPO|nr:hypothetical protein DPMN_071581 [Dreissena polymorpha]